MQYEINTHMVGFKANSNTNTENWNVVTTVNYNQAELYNLFLEEGTWAIKVYNEDGYIIVPLKVCESQVPGRDNRYKTFHFLSNSNKQLFQDHLIVHGLYKKERALLKKLRAKTYNGIEASLEEKIQSYFNNQTKYGKHNRYQRKLIKDFNDKLCRQALLLAQEGNSYFECIYKVLPESRAESFKEWWESLE